MNTTNSSLAGILKKWRGNKILEQIIIKIIDLEF